MRLARAEKIPEASENLPNAFDWKPHLFNKDVEDFCKCFICERAPNRSALTVTGAAKRRQETAERRKAKNEEQFKAENDEAPSQDNAK